MLSRAERRRAARRRGTTLRSWLLTYAIALAIALSTVGTALALVDRTVDQKIESIEKIDVDVTEPDPGGPRNFLLIGSDTREGENGAPAEGEPGGQRSDTIMVLRVDPQQHTAALVSFPRDLLVEIPGIGEAKINAAYNEGPQTLIDTIQGNFPITINHYVSVDFASFAGIVDAMGGITIDFPYVARNETTLFFQGIYGPACYGMDGAQALNYVRQRSTGDPAGYEQYVDGEWQQDPVPDLARIRRQQDFIRTMATKAFERSRNDPLAANRIADQILSELVTDDGFDRGAVNALIQAFDEVDPSDSENLRMETLPTFGDTLSDGQDVLILDEGAAAPLFGLLNGTPVPEAVPPESTDVPTTSPPDEPSVTTTTVDAPAASAPTTGAAEGPIDENTGWRIPDSTRC